MALEPSLSGPGGPGLPAQMARYASRFPAEAAVAQAFAALSLDMRDRFVRTRLDAHFTAGAWLVSADGLRVLMTHHRKLGRRLQLGGHADGVRDLAAVALQEAVEESGLSGLVLVDAEPFDLDRHWIPARGEVAGHWHHELRYVVQATAGEHYVVGPESLDLAWRPVSDVTSDADESLARMAGKWLARAVWPRAA